MYWWWIIKLCWTDYVNKYIYTCSCVVLPAYELRRWSVSKLLKKCFIPPFYPLICHGKNKQTKPRQTDRFTKYAKGASWQPYWVALGQLVLRRQNTLTLPETLHMFISFSPSAFHRLVLQVLIWKFILLLVNTNNFHSSNNGQRMRDPTASRHQLISDVMRPSE